MIRFFDIFFSLTALILLSPLFLLVILVLKFSGEREVFFLQERVGRNKEIFKLFKFATMLKNSPTTGTGTVTMKNDPRVLPVGIFLRKTKINELPQLINILIGDLSIIGPRPQTLSCFEAFTSEAQDIIAQIKPGLSGIGPIIFRSEEDILEGHIGTLEFYNNIIGPYKGKVESWYLDKQNLVIYFSLIFITAWVVIFPSSSLAWKVFKDLPIPPEELKANLNFPD